MNDSFLDDIEDIMSKEPKYPPRSDHHITKRRNYPSTTSTSSESKSSPLSQKSLNSKRRSTDNKKNSSDNALNQQSTKENETTKTADTKELKSMIEDIVSSHTKAESEKILQRLQELHVDSKLNVVKQLYWQTEDLLEELQPSKDTSKLRLLVSENERLREDNLILQLRNEELMRKVQEAILIKEENIKLKMKIKELNK